MSLCWRDSGRRYECRVAHRPIVLHAREGIPRQWVASDSVGNHGSVYMSFRSEDATSIVIDQLSAMILAELRALSNEQYSDVDRLDDDMALMKRRVKELRRVREEIEMLMTGAFE